AIHGVGRREREAHRRVSRVDRDAREPSEPRPPGGGLEEQLLARERLLPQAPGHFEMMGGVGPGALDLLLERRLLVEHHHRVARQQIQQRLTLPGTRWGRSMLRAHAARAYPLAPYRQYRDLLDWLPGSLCV